MSLFHDVRAANKWKRERKKSAGMNANGILLRIKRGELPMLRFALDHARSSISEAHPADHAVLKVLIERLDAAEKGAKS